AYMRFKYVSDSVIAFIALIITSPIFLIVAVAIKIEDGGKIIFTQPRTGVRGKIFKCYKFRSMKDTEVPFDPHRPVIKDGNENLTKVGKVIRKFKIDELPQLLNIIRGDMCIIGPRPLLAHYFRYDRWELIKFEMRPGLTGLGQVMGNSHLNNRLRRYYDAYYVTHASLLLDIKIFFKTIGVLFAGERRFIKLVHQDEYDALKADIEQNYEISEQTIAAFKAEDSLNEEVAADGGKSTE
ncbi:MAG: sugar transferase, partial [Clostridia bacterium]|nr:sugar transferase [Clostridia bacterium]